MVRKPFGNEEGEGSTNHISLSGAGELQNEEFKKMVNGNEESWKKFEFESLSL
jgi:hypothetical protein